MLCYEEVSGLEANFNKLELVPVGPVRNISMLANFLGCKVSTLLLNYLGLPLGDAFRALAIIMECVNFIALESPCKPFHSP